MINRLNAGAGDEIPSGKVGELLEKFKTAERAAEQGFKELAGLIDSGAEFIELQKLMPGLTREDLEVFEAVGRGQRPTQDGVLQFLSWMGRQKLFESN